MTLDYGRKSNIFNLYATFHFSDFIYFGSEKIYKEEKIITNY